MNAFLETSALIDLAFKDSQTRAKVRTQCPSVKITSQYVLFELCRGYLRNLILLYNKAGGLSRLSQLFEYINRVRRKAYLAATITETFQRYFAEGLNRGVINAHPTLSVDECMLLHFRGHLRKQIRYNWKRIPALVDSIIDEVGCRDPIEDPVLDDDDIFH